MRIPVPKTQGLMSNFTSPTIKRFTAKSHSVQKTPTEEYVSTQYDRGANVLSYLEQYSIPAGATLLDHGCASGGTMLPFLEAGWRAIGIDPHEESVRKGVEELELDIRVASGECLPFEDGKFDLVISLGSLEHVHDFRKSMSELHRVLKDGGVLFIRWRSNTLWGSPYEYYNHNHYRFFSPETWRLGA